MSVYFKSTFWYPRFFQKTNENKSRYHSRIFSFVFRKNLGRPFEINWPLGKVTSMTDVSCLHFCNLQCWTTQLCTFNHCKILLNSNFNILISFLLFRPECTLLIWLVEDAVLVILYLRGLKGIRLFSYLSET